MEKFVKRFINKINTIERCEIFVKFNGITHVQTFETISEKFLGYYTSAPRNSENSTFSARNSLTRVARSAYTEWLIPLECLASTFLPLLSLPGTLSFGTGWRSTTSLTRCLMSAHLRASRQVDPHLYPDLGVWIRTWMHPPRVSQRRECDEDVGRGSGAIFSYVENYYFVLSCEGRNNCWNIYLYKLIFIYC